MMMPGDPSPGPLCVPLLPPSSLPSLAPRTHCFDPRRTCRPFLLYVYHPSDAFSRRAVAPDALDLFLKELRPLRETGVAFDFLFAVAPPVDRPADETTAAAAAAAAASRAEALLARLEDAVGRLEGARPGDIGPVLGGEGEGEAARLRYGVIAAGGGGGGKGANSHPHDHHPWGWAPSVLAVWPDPSAMRLVRVWADPQPSRQQQEEAEEEDGTAAAAASFRPAAAAAAAQQPLLTATRLGSRFPWLLPGFQPHPDDPGAPPNTTLSYPLAAVGGGFVRRACAEAGLARAADDAGEQDADSDKETLGDPRDAVVLIPFAYGSSREAEGGRCTYWHVLRAAQRDLGAAGALFHAPLLETAAAPPSAPGGLDEQLFQPSYVPWPGFGAPPFDEDADLGPEEGGAEIPAASVERGAAAAIRAALLRSLSDGSSRRGSSPLKDKEDGTTADPPVSFPRAGFIARALPTGAAALAVDARGRLQEAGWFKLPSLEHAAWAARYLSWRERRLDARLDALAADEAEGRALVVPVIGRVGKGGGEGDGCDDGARPLSADKGRVSASVELPPASTLARFSKVEADFELDCPGGVDASCPQWDHVLQAFVCCSLSSSSSSSLSSSSLSSSWRRPACSPSPAADCWGTKWRRANPAAAQGDDDDDAEDNDDDANTNSSNNACGRELLRVVTPFRRRGGRWLVDVTRLRGLLHPPVGGDEGGPITCAFHVQGPPWAGPWVPRLALRFSEPLPPSAGGRGGVGPAEAALSPSSSSLPNSAVHVKALWPTAPGASFDVSESPPGGGNCDTSGAHPPAPLPPPPPKGKRLVRATLVAAVTGHGAAEFVPSAHAFFLEQQQQGVQEEGGGGGGGEEEGRPPPPRRVHLLTADLASFRPGGVWGSGARGCVASVDAGSVPNEHGTWLYTRAGWCDGGPADGPWAADVTGAVREAWRREEKEEEGGKGGGGRARIAYGCLFPSGGWGEEAEEEEGLTGARRRGGRQGQERRWWQRQAGRPDDGGDGGRAAVPSSSSSPSSSARRRLLDEPDAAFMMEATLVLEYEEGGEDEGGGLAVV